jgi:SAM-dependent methyltransferase
MKLILFCLTLFILPLSVAAQDAVPHDEHEMHRLHSDPKAYISALEDPKRDAYQKPQEVMTALGIKPGGVIADIGAGSGYFTFRLAQHVGDKGKVYAVDVNPDMILHINRRIRELHVSNVVTVLSDPDDPLLPEHSIDRFFFSESWHHIENQTKYLGANEANAKTGRRGRHDRLSEKRSSGGPAAANENRQGRSHQTDGDPRFSPTEGVHIPPISVFSDFYGEVKGHTDLFAGRDRSKQFAVRPLSYF